MVPKKAQKFKRKKNFSGFKNHSISSSDINLVGKDNQNSNIEDDLVRVIPVQQSGPEFKNGSKIACKIDQIGIGGRGACNPQADSRGFFNPSTGSRGFYNPQADNIQHSGQEFTDSPTSVQTIVSRGAPVGFESEYCTYLREQFKLAMTSNDFRRAFSLDKKLKVESGRLRSAQFVHGTIQTTLPGQKVESAADVITASSCPTSPTSHQPSTPSLSPCFVIPTLFNKQVGIQEATIFEASQGGKSLKVKKRDSKKVIDEGRRRGGALQAIPEEVEDEEGRTTRGKKGDQLKIAG